MRLLGLALLAVADARTVKAHDGGEVSGGIPNFLSTALNALRGPQGEAFQVHPVLAPRSPARATPGGAQTPAGAPALPKVARIPPAEVAAARAGAIVMELQDPYQELGVGRQATEKEIKNAYRQAARKYHPDVNPDGEEKFKELSEAYAILSDPQQRKMYDQFGMAGVKKGGGGMPDMSDFDFGDIFDSFFGGGGGPRQRRSGPIQGDDLRFDLEIDFTTAAFGGTRKIRVTHLETCGTCTGSGVAPGSSVNTCSTCGGRGVVTQVMNTILGRIQQQTPCPTCGGTGQVVDKYCGTCDGNGVQRKSKTITITIPPGVDDGNRLRVRAEGDAGPKGGPAGDLYVFLSVPRDRRFRREGTDIYSDLSVSYLDAILGSKKTVATIDGEVDLTIPAGTQPGTTLNIQGKGVPKLNNVNVRGTHFVKVQVEIPTSLSAAERDLVTKLQEQR